MRREQEIEARAKVATKGPWVAVPIAPGDWHVQVLSEKGYKRLAIEGDAEFLAHAREDIPYLLEKLEAMRKEVASAPPSPRIRRMERILKEGE